MSAYRDGDRVVVLMPAHIARAEERQWIGVMLERLQARERRRRPSDADLLARAATLRRRYLSELDDDRAPSSIRWVTNQGSRWGSCTPADRTVRLSSRLQGMPRWVIDYVLLHELAHLLEPGHTERFWGWVNRYPWTERARGYLDGVAATADLALSDLADISAESGVTESDAAESGVEQRDTEYGPGLAHVDEDRVSKRRGARVSGSATVADELPLFD